MISWRFFSALVGVSIWMSAASVQVVAGAPLSTPFEVLLGYEVSYSQGGRSVVHRGVDLSASEGDAVSSPFSGRVSFAGRVPSPVGGSRNAVTIEFGDGLRATFLPLDRIAVSSGQQVSVGDDIGSVAVVAGESTPAPHLHVSIRRGETYIDPMPFLPIPPAMIPQPNDIPQKAPAPVVDTAPQPVSPTAPQPVNATAPQPVSPTVPQPVSPTVPQPVSSTAPQPVSPAAPQQIPLTAMQGGLGTAPLSSVNVPQGAKLLTPSMGLQVGNLADERSADITCESVLSMTGDGAIHGLGMIGATEAQGVQPETATMRSLLQPSDGNPQGVAGGSLAARQILGESTSLPISAVGVVIVAIAAMLGLMPIVRGGIETSTEDTGISTREQLAAAVGR